MFRQPGHTQSYWSANNHIDAFYCTAINDKLVIFHLPVIYFRS